jgi:hypothetical protein
MVWRWGSRGRTPFECPEFKPQFYQKTKNKQINELVPRAFRYQPPLSTEEGMEIQRG